MIAFEVDHGDVIKPCYGYRFEYQGRSAVLSSDTRYNQNVIKYGRGADLLVHEVAMARPGADVGGLRPADRGAPHDAARSRNGVRADQAEARRLHALVCWRATKFRAPTVDDLVAETRQTYGGPLQVGEDLMQFEIGDDVTVRQFDASADRFGEACGTNRRNEA